MKFIPKPKKTTIKSTNFTIENRVQNIAWMNSMRGLACGAIVFHHWFLFLRYPESSIFDILQTIAGTFIHLFFLLSGCGLTFSYYKNVPRFSWFSWFKNRFFKIYLPYCYIVIFLFLVFYIVKLFNPILMQNQLTLNSFFFNLFLIRNFVSEGQGFVPHFWYMPVIIGLYFSFPLLILIQKKTATFIFLLILSVINFGSIYLFSTYGYEISHQSAIFLFFTFEFGIGMIIGKFLFEKGAIPRFFTRFYSPIIGFAFYGFSFFLTEKWDIGNIYNDPLTSMGVFMIVFFCLVHSIKILPQFFHVFLSKLNKESYFIYLLHCPFIIFLIAPALKAHKRGAIFVLVFFICYLFIIYLLARMLRLTYNGLIKNLGHRPRFKLCL